MCLSSYNMSQTLDNLKSVAKGTVKLTLINGNTRNAQLQKLISIPLESFDSITTIGAKVGKYDITTNPLKASIEQLSAELTTLITNMWRVLKDDDAKLIPATTGDDFTSKSSLSGDDVSPESLEEAKQELQSLLDANLAERKSISQRQREL